MQRATLLEQTSVSDVLYAELHCLTNFTFLEGASHADELATQAAELGYYALAVTDRNSLAGVVRAHSAAKAANLKLLVGAEIAPVDGPRAVALATDRAAYGRLARLITVGRRQAEKGACHLTFDDVARHSAGLIAGVIPEQHEPLFPDTNLCAYREAFGERCYVLAELHYGVDDGRRLARLQAISRRTNVPLVAAGDVHYHVPERMALQHVVTAIRNGTPVAELEELCLPNAERHLRRLNEIRTIFAAHPELIERTVEIAQQCTFSLDELRYEYPQELAPPAKRRLAI